MHLKKSYVSGYSDGTFRSDDTVTRAEAMAILKRVVGCEGIGEGNSFTAVPSRHWAYSAITAAATGHNHE